MGKMQGKDKPEGGFRKPTVHNMKRRSYMHDYSRAGYYHITMTVAKGLHQPLGRMAGRLDRADGEEDAPHVALSAVGKMVEEELRGSIRKHYPMLEVIEYVVMPEHLHFLLRAHRDVVSKNGKPTHLGHVIAGFKYGCNLRYWALTEKQVLATESPDTRESAGKSGARPGGREGSGKRGSEKGGQEGAGGATVPGGSVARRRALFAPGYCDVMPVDEGQLATQRAYIRGNPRSRLLRMSLRQRLLPQRCSVNTAVTLRALYGYLERECPWQMSQEVKDWLASRLLQANGQVACDSYGPTDLLTRRLLPVVCHRCDAALFEKQKARCLEEAAAGAVLVSARIAKGEQDIMDSALKSGFPVVLLQDNGFPEVYHPSASYTDDCAEGRLLLLSPWSYQYRGKNEGIHVPWCKTMNCVAQAICKTKDNWWK